MTTENPQPWALDLCCCQGGMTHGLQRAGFHVTGVDVESQSRYVGEEFVQAEAVEFVLDNMEEIRRRYAFIQAGPPCQGYTKCWRIQKREHPRLIGAVRAVLNLTGLPWVIENVEEARSELQGPVMLCGGMPEFGLKTYRHRLFEAGGGLVLPQPHHDELTMHTAPLTKMGRPRKPGHFAHYVGNFSGVQEAREDMGMEWANRDGIREAIPVAYGQWVGEHAMGHIREECAA